jgi:hypothetical protein
MLGLFKSWFASSPGSRRPSVRPQLESLETRDLPTISVGHMFLGVAPETFVIGLDNQVYAQKFDANGTPAYGYFLTAPGQFKKIQVARTNNNTSVVFGIDMNDQLHALKINAYGDPVGGFVPMAPDPIQDVVVVPEFYKSSEVFVLGMDNQVYAQPLTNSGDPIGNTYLPTAPGQVLKVLMGVAQSNAQVVPELFAVGMDSQIYAQEFNPDGTSKGFYFLTAPGQVDVQGSIDFGFANPATGLVPELFVTGLDDRIYAQKFASNGDPLGGYLMMSTGQVLSFSVGPMSNDTLHPELFALGLDSQVYALKISATGDPVGDFVLTAPGQVRNLTASYVQKNGNYYLELFVTGMDSQVYVQLFDVNGNSQGDYILAAPGAIR